VRQQKYVSCVSQKYVNFFVHMWQQVGKSQGGMSRRIGMMAAAVCISAAAAVAIILRRRQGKPGSPHIKTGSLQLITVHEHEHEQILYGFFVHAAEQQGAAPQIQQSLLQPGQDQPKRGGESKRQNQTQSQSQSEPQPEQGMVLHIDPDRAVTLYIDLETMGQLIWAFETQSIPKNVTIVAVALPYYSTQNFRNKWCNQRGVLLLQAHSKHARGDMIASDIAERMHRAKIDIDADKPRGAATAKAAEFWVASKDRELQSQVPKTCRLIDNAKRLDWAGAVAASSCA
jgi:hypothetical protein